MPPPNQRKRGEKAVTLIEIAIGTALLGLVAATGLASLTVLNKNAVSSRVMTNAREIVQRNIEAAVGTPFTTISTPAILALATNAVWDDDGGGDNLETIYSSRNYTALNDGTPRIMGTLKRTVTAEPNSAGADIRRVTFHLDYTLFGRQLSYEMTTLRAIDK
jgi:type II secretory pathway pseudopilin PulG